jgi:hypothetical protein
MTIAVRPVLPGSMEGSLTPYGLATGALAVHFDVRTDTGLSLDDR